MNPDQIERRKVKAAKPMFYFERLWRVYLAGAALWLVFLGFCAVFYWIVIGQWP